jgi:hypothetical protein
MNSKWFNFHHLSEASKYAGHQMSYIQHWKMSMYEALFLFVLSFASIVHAFFPMLFDFQLLRLRIDRLKILKSKLPLDPTLKKITFDDI